MFIKSVRKGLHGGKRARTAKRIRGGVGRTRVIKRRSRTGRMRR